MKRRWFNPRVAALAAAPFLVALLACSGGRSAQPGPTTVVGSSEIRVDDPEVHAMLVDSCYACHSDHRTDPWYAHLAPSSWSSHGLQRLDFSSWQALAPESRKAELAAIAVVVRDGDMPLKDYTFFNRAAKLSEPQKERLARWADGEAKR